MCHDTNKLVGKILLSFSYNFIDSLDFHNRAHRLNATIYWIMES